MLPQCGTLSKVDCDSVELVVYGEDNTDSPQVISPKQRDVGMVASQDAQLQLAGYAVDNRTRRVWQRI